MENVGNFFLVVPDSAAVFTDLLNLVQEFKTLKIRKNGVHFNIIVMNIEASFISNNGNLQVIIVEKSYNSITSRLVKIIVESVDTTIYTSE